MATAITLTVSGQKPAAIAISSVEEAITITASAGGRRTFGVVCNSAWLYNSVSAQANPMPVAANQMLVLDVKDASTLVFYATHATTDNLHVICLG